MVYGNMCGKVIAIQFNILLSDQNISSIEHMEIFRCHIIVEILQEIFYFKALKLPTHKNHEWTIHCRDI
jgi:hypothetical protein